MKFQLLKLTVACIVCASCNASNRQNSLLPSHLNTQGSSATHSVTKISKSSQYFWQGKSFTLLCNAVNNTHSLKPLPTITGISAVGFGQLPKNLYGSLPEAKRLALLSGQQGWEKTQPQYIKYLIKIGGGSSSNALHILKRLEHRENVCFEKYSQELIQEVELIKKRSQKAGFGGIYNMKTRRRISTKSAIEARIQEWNLLRKLLLIVANRYASTHRELKKLEVLEQRKIAKNKNNQTVNVGKAEARAVKLMLKETPRAKLTMQEKISRTTRETIAILKKLDKDGLLTTLETSLQ